MKTIITLLFLSFFVSYGMYSQAGKISAETQFKNDLEDNNLKIYILGGIAGVIKMKDRDFAKKYGFTYHDFGCLAPPDMDFYTSYNIFVLEHLKERYGCELIEAVRQDILGWKKWNEKN